MNRKLLVLSCSQTKNDSENLLPAINRYDGPAYKVLRSFLREYEWSNDLSVAILSAKYGLMGGLTDISDYDERMTDKKALYWVPTCKNTLKEWMNNHNEVNFALGKTYLKAVQPSIDEFIKDKSKIFHGGIGMKLHQIKEFLYETNIEKRRVIDIEKINHNKMTYFLPDWDDLLDENYNFSNDEFSGVSPKERGDKHCSVLMKPQKMSDGILVSLAQHLSGKGPLKKIDGVDEKSLAPVNLRNRFKLGETQLLFGDCGAFSYIGEDEPTIDVKRAVSLYNLHGFDFGASIDHIPIPKVKVDGVVKETTKKFRKHRIDVTIRNAKEFIIEAKNNKSTFIPVGVIQALSSDQYAETLKLYYNFGYRYIALGGMVTKKDAEIKEIVHKVMIEANKLTPKPWIHLFGVFRPNLQFFFRSLGVNSFDSATYFRKAWLRSDQNYLASDGKWYAAIRVPMTKDSRTRNKLLNSGIDIIEIEKIERKVMKLLEEYDNDEANINEVLDAVIYYDNLLSRSSEVGTMKEKYRRTLEDKPWRSCNCPYCSKLGIHIAIFRGSNRNKRRGAHNTLMLYNSLGE